ncbi:DUF4246 domain-containing protein [Phanerochaete sordida]|uniref:DUF4246 domain-containing protein n=1 Tax=Phanerochaete sordida TaxID=48140 RepID=A0A9P3G9Z9_9APHY|nr:DUF4246 domain-containing protein [Phanerochaete sordida]
MAVYTKQDAAGLQMSGVFRHPFRDRYQDFGSECGPYDDAALSANVRNMCALSAAIRAKVSWRTKAQNPIIRARWREEAISAPVPYGDAQLTEYEVDYVLNELAWHASRKDEETGIEASVFSRIWQSDRLVNDALRNELLRVVARLEDIPEDQRDWHPHTDHQVLDLVHPSLYCIVYDQTVLRAGYDPRPLPSASPFEDACEDTRGLFRSDLFSWLPTDFAVSEDGTTAKALCYINNLSPYTHASAYPVMERLVARFVPLWERVLSESRAGREMRPLPGWNHSFDENDADGSVQLKGRTLQVIIKLANILLTPEKPEYAGGSWHVEGMVNEAIVSTGIYYYDEENITESSLAFRMAVSAPEDYEQFDYDGVKAEFGFTIDEPLNQQIGSVVTKQGRCIAFPNVFQHQVQPFELADKSKPGHRKIVALFLVDPELPKPRPSTTNILPQQAGWMKLVLRDVAAKLRAVHGADAKGFGALPVEVIDMIVDQAEWLMSRQEAEEHRLALMDERTAMTGVNDECMFSMAFNMCEH